MVKPQKEESFYDLLRVTPHSSVSEITNAYYAAKNAFSKDSLATYSLMPEESSAEILAQLETAYLTLTNPDRRREYDKRLANTETFHTEDPMTPHEANIHTNPTATYPPPSEAVSLSQTADSNLSNPTIADIHLNLAQIRESKGLTLTDVSRITKIPVRYLQSLEANDLKGLPATVYIQGFLKNLAQLYRLEPKSTVSLYFE
ncbi:MAG: helix-turn-helix domain-containing protein, partial [Deltaproteobacteria bacterium]